MYANANTRGIPAEQHNAAVTEPTAGEPDAGPAVTPEHEDPENQSDDAQDCGDGDADPQPGQCRVDIDRREPLLSQQPVNLVPDRSGVELAIAENALPSPTTAPTTASGRRSRPDAVERSAGSPGLSHHGPYGPSRPITAHHGRIRHRGPDLQSVAGLVEVNGNGAPVASLSH